MWGQSVDQANVDIIGPDAPLNWPHDFTLDRLELGEHRRVTLDAIDRPTVLFVQSGHVQVAWQSDVLTLGPGDTITLPQTVTFGLTSPDKGVIYRVEGQA